MIRKTMWMCERRACSSKAVVADFAAASKHNARNCISFHQFANGQRLENSTQRKERVCKICRMRVQLVNKLARKMNVKKGLRFFLPKGMLD
jgi:hypothetical protein